VLAILFLALSLAVTPANQLFHWPWLMNHRRALGLTAFFYGLSHFVAYFFFDRGGSLASAVKDVEKRPFILLGLSCLVLMVPLAVTSTNAMIRHLGKRWKQLHRLAYAIAAGAVVHYWMIVKSDTTYPLLFACFFGSLLGYRLWKTTRRHLKAS
jgi:sulfoxide reductase heme-binding subunit YedZ